MKRPKTIRIEVKDKAEGEALLRGLNDPEVRAFVVTVGALLPFDNRARARMLRFLADQSSDTTQQP
jgi:hypothetical protein